MIGAGGAKFLNAELAGDSAIVAALPWQRSCKLRGNERNEGL
jgi:hypothetical protein